MKKNPEFYNDLKKAKVIDSKKDEQYFNDLQQMSLALNSGNRINKVLAEKYAFEVPLFVVAATYNDIDLLQKEYEKMRNTNVCTRKGNTSLHVAAKYNNYKLIRMLINEYNCDPNIKNNNGFTPLLTAFFYGNKESVFCLVKYSKIVIDDLVDILKKTNTRKHHDIFDKIMNYLAKS